MNASAPALSTFTVTDAAELATVERSGFIESRHAGSAVVLAPDGTVVSRFGDPDALVYPRSCLKPFQTIAILSTGVKLVGSHAAIATASHAGTPGHVDLVRELLDRGSFREDDLKCPPDWPADATARDALVRDGALASPLFMGCSGKHAAMLLACKENDWPIDTYLDPGHPLQSRTREVVEDLTGEPIRSTGIDGCGSPVFSTSLVALARGIGRVASASSRIARDRGKREATLDDYAAHLVAAILTNGWAIDGLGRANTIVIDQLGIVAKLGAEGLMVLSTQEGTSVAIKVLDGSLRAATLVGLQLLVKANALEQTDIDTVLPDLGLAVFGGAAEVGQIRVSTEIHDPRLPIEP